MFVSIAGFSLLQSKKTLYYYCDYCFLLILFLILLFD